MKPQAAGSALQVFGAFLKLGLSSFGGPIAHLGYFRNEFVGRRRWLDEHAYADLVALRQFLPGPASSQVGFAIGLARAGWRGALGAWLGFTLPSALLLVLFALGVTRVGEHNAALAGALHALKAVAVAVIAQAIWTMARSLCPDWPRRLLAVVATMLTLAWPTAAAQMVALAVCAGIGWRTLTVAEIGDSSFPEFPVGPRTGVLALAVFAVLLIGLPLAAAGTGWHWLQLFEAFYRAGALVFGGGHVVLPLLQAGVVGPGWIDDASFLAGYGAAQAVPGPLFTFAAYLGSVIGIGSDAASGPLAGSLLGAAVCLLAVFLPGCVILVAALPFWSRLRARPALRAVVAGVNAGVVGVLLAALIDPVWPSAIRSVFDLALAGLCLALLSRFRWPPLAVVLLAAAAGAILAAANGAFPGA